MEGEIEKEEEGEGKSARNRGGRGNWPAFKNIFDCWLTSFFAGFVFFVRSEGSKRWDKQYYRRSKEGGEEVGGCLPREVQQPSTPPQTSWLPSWCRLFHKKPKKPPTGGGGGEGRFTVISCDSQVFIIFKTVIVERRVFWVINATNVQGSKGRGWPALHTLVSRPLQVKTFKRKLSGLSW